jgi:hypothetical protein
MFLNQEIRINLKGQRSNPQTKNNPQTIYRSLKNNQILIKLITGIVFTKINTLIILKNIYTPKNLKLKQMCHSFKLKKRSVLKK